MTRPDELLHDRELRDAFHEAAMKGTPRSQRAKQFSTELFHIMRDFMPSDRECRERVMDYLALLSFQSNACFITVPLGRLIAQAEADDVRVEKLTSPQTGGAGSK